ncbi:hypothetical protein GYMLUDRAFT_46231 [Collybiopsis luxurians FD-317 M1]|uniref:Uncharacterized protein n=1 Tax=Collybiopsis luxurians FD-317 M1 TaxID=944289 RepID=A0A0D0CGN8_9AGAR|nr:hypothetical protein GYMLUDRAFT_46231 [Collybiopsis luxurians FD-317 M1]
MVPRDWVSELPGGKFLSARPPRPPSADAEPDQFVKSQRRDETRIYCDRPRNRLQISIPIALLVPCFGTFQTNIRTLKPSDRSLQFAKRMSDELCVFYTDETQRETAFRELLGEFLEVVIPKVQIGDYTTDGAVMYETVGKDGASRLIIQVKLEQACSKGEPSFQVSLYYLENIRLVRKLAVGGNSQAAGWMRSRMPSILITHVGE